MSSSAETAANLIASLNDVSNILNKYLPIFIYAFGIIGNLLNGLVLSQAPLRSNPSAACFLMSSIAGLLVIVSGLTSRMMSGYAVDLTLTVDWICKVRNFLVYGGRTVALYTIALAAVDRWLSSSVDEHLRRLSTMKNTRRAMLAIVTYACVINAPILYCYEANLAGILRGCYGSTYVCRVLTDSMYALGTTMVPLLLMVTFGIRTMNNIRHVRNRIGTVTGSMVVTDKPMNMQRQQRQQKRKRDRHLLKMLLVQILLLCLFTCPHPVEKLYSSIVPALPAQSLENAIQNFIFTCLTLLTFTASGMPFYIYTLSGGSVFRNALFGLLKRAVCKCQQ
jgi:hypothetical protein